jgi:hypothetical protein
MIKLLNEKDYVELKKSLQPQGFMFYDNVYVESLVDTTGLYPTSYICDLLLFQAISTTIVTVYASNRRVDELDNKIDQLKSLMNSKRDK